ncbi:hypothetical protein CCH79_00003868 [Gambusia affinis]|uniref:Uncharacterized protein n=1 Tax=Gambusia affinis TaxID=33528 RepID=A0A315VDI0_GAMAF|nr:hypothetical protein CCH79_00003868 [Gambusia affinis]
MNFEEQHLDLCNVKTKANVDDDHNTTNNTEAVTPRISELMTDSDLEKQTSVPTEASETYLMPQLTDNLQTAEEDNQDTLEIDVVNGNKKSSAQDTPAVGNPTDLISSNNEHHKIVMVEEVNMKEDRDSNSAQAVVEAGDDGVDMDIGVDLSLDESGVLEAESANATSISDNALNSKSSPRDVPAGRTAEGQTNAIQTCSTEASAADQAGLYPLVEEGEEKHKQSGKRVTFPTDDNIVSGAVEPKDPWRHANVMQFDEVVTNRLTSAEFYQSLFLRLYVLHLEDVLLLPIVPDGLSCYSRPEGCLFPRPGQIPHHILRFLEFPPLCSSPSFSTSLPNKNLKSVNLFFNGKVVRVDVKMAGAKYREPLKNKKLKRIEIVDNDPKDATSATQSLSARTVALNVAQSSDWSWSLQQSGVAAPFNPHKNQEQYLLFAALSRGTLRWGVGDGEAQNVTVEEILSSYKQACQKLNCKPIPKVLKQIQTSVSSCQTFSSSSSSVDA